MRVAPIEQRRKKYLILSGGWQPIVLLRLVLACYMRLACMRLAKRSVSLFSLRIRPRKRLSQNFPASVCATEICEISRGEFTRSASPI